MRHSRLARIPCLSLRAAIACGLSSCVPANLATAPAAPVAAERHRALRSDIDTIVVIYAENRAFDNLYGNFPARDNLSEVLDRDGRPLPGYHPQLDRDGSVLSTFCRPLGAASLRRASRRW